MQPKNDRRNDNDKDAKTEKIGIKSKESNEFRKVEKWYIQETEAGRSRR